MNSRYNNDARRGPAERRAATPSIHDPKAGETPHFNASGSGRIAERIVAVGREHDVPIYQDAGLVEALARLEVGARIPRELYTVVAEVLAFVYAVDDEAANR